MAKIVKSKDAPEGDVRVSVGPTSFKLGDEGYETDDAAVIQAGETHPFLDVEYDDPDTDPKAEMKAVRELRKEQVKADKQNATKDPLEPAVEIPTSVADLKESK